MCRLALQEDEQDIMNFQRFLLVITVLGLTAPSAYAANFNEKHTLYESHVLNIDVYPWMQNMEKAVVALPEYADVARTLNSQLVDSQYVICLLKVSRNGSAETVSVCDSSGYPNLDAMVKKLINGAKFQPPPNNIPSERGIKIVFGKLKIGNTEQIKVWSGLDPATKSKQFVIEYYIPPDAAQPWRKNFKAQI